MLQNPNLPSTVLSIVLALEVPPFSININLSNIYISVISFTENAWYG